MYSIIKECRKNCWVNKWLRKKFGIFILIIVLYYVLILGGCIGWKIEEGIR